MRRPRSASSLTALMIGTDIFSLERGEHLSGFETVDDLQLLATSAARRGKYSTHLALDDEVREVALDQLLRSDVRG